jgi:hypothetical protein
MEACISVCTYAKSSIHRSSHPIPSTVWLIVEFSPTNSPKDEGKLFIHSNPLEQVHIVSTSVTKLSLAERLVLLYLLGATDGNVIIVCGHRHVTLCKIMARPCGLVWQWHKGQRPQWVLRSIVTGVWTRASAGRARREHSLHSTQQLLHPAQHLQQQHTTRST